MAFLKYLFPHSCNNTALSDICLGLLAYAGVAFVALLQFTICFWLHAVGVVSVVLLIVGLAYALAGAVILLVGFFTAVRTTVHRVEKSE